jgi:large subunit ribosomal protein L35
MPKMKTNRGAAKRFKRTGTGKLKRRRANRNHILTKKATKRKRQLRALPTVGPSDARAINRMLRKQ